MGWLIGFDNVIVSENIIKGKMGKTSVVVEGSGKHGLVVGCDNVIVSDQGRWGKTSEKGERTWRGRGWCRI